MTKTKVAVSGIEARKATKVKTILISQPKPSNDKSPYFDLEKRLKVKIDWRKFISIEGADAKSFRKDKINPLDFSAIIFSSKLAITHFFRICEEFRVKMPQETKYFCSSEAIALYLQKFIEYRKRKVFYQKEGKSTLLELLPSTKQLKTTFLLAQQLTRTISQITWMPMVSITERPYCTMWSAVICRI